MKKRRRGRRKILPREDMALQITSMADIFTIILVFLLKSFSTGVSNIAPTEALILPEAHAQDEVKDGLKIEVSSGAIIVDGKAVTKLVDFAFERSDVESNGTPRSLNTALILEHEKDLKRQPSSIATPGGPGAGQGKAAEDAQIDHSRIVVMADESTPYRTLKAVMASSANAGFGEFKLIVVEDQ